MDPAIHDLVNRMEESMKNKFYLWLAYRLPRCLVKWCGIRILGHATTGPWSHQIVPELTAMDALKRWEEGAA
jgi:hypothetical protein